MTSTGATPSGSPPSGTAARPRVVMFEGARCPVPLDASRTKQIQVLGRHADILTVAFSPDWRYRRLRQPGEFYLVPRLRTPALRYVTMLSFGTAVVLWLVVARRANVVVAKRPYEGCAAAAVKRLASGLGRRVVLIVENRGDFEKYVFLQRQVRFPGLYRRVMHWAAARGIRGADLFRAVSDATREQLEARGAAKPVVQFPGWTDLEPFWQAGDATPRRSSAVLYAGVVVPRKGVHHLLEAVAMARRTVEAAHLSVVGWIENPPYAEALRAQAARLGLTPWVRFEAAVDQRELARRMAEAELFVLPTSAEGLPRVVMEAMAARTPVVATAVPGVTQLVQDGVTGLLVPPNDPVALADRLAWALTHPAEMRALAARAREFIAELDPNEAYARGWAALLDRARQLLGAAGDRGPRDAGRAPTAPVARVDGRR